MDEVFSEFLRTFGGETGRQQVPISSVEKFTGKLPGLLLDYWLEHGWCGYGKGLFWMVDPQEYEGVVAAWLEDVQFDDPDTFHVIARSAFGDLYLWGETSCNIVKLTSCLSRYVVFESSLTVEQSDMRLQSFLLALTPEGNDIDGLFEYAYQRLGSLNFDEVYGFTPALMLGGSGAVEDLQKVKVVEHLVLLSQLAPLEPYAFSGY